MSLIGLKIIRFENSLTKESAGHLYGRSFFFGNSVEDEYAALINFTNEELKQIAKNGFEVALVDEATRAKWIAEVDALS